MRLNKRFASIVLTVLLLLGMVGCSSETAETPSSDTPAEEPSTGAAGDAANDTAGDAPAPGTAALAWTDFELVDVETGETFTIGELSGTPVYVQAFAVW